MAAIGTSALAAEGFEPSGSSEDILFGVDLRGLGWAYSFAAVLAFEFDRQLYSAHLKIGKALDVSYSAGLLLRRPAVPVAPLGPPRYGDDTAKSVLSGPLPPNEESAGWGEGDSSFRPFEGMPRMVFESMEPGIGVLFKPPGWEVDDEDQRPCGKRLSAFLQWKYPSSGIVWDPEHAYGIIHRLDVPSSGLILTGTTFTGHYVLKWQLDTAQIVREYVILCHGWMPPSLREIDAPVHHIPQRSPAKGTLPWEKSARRSTVCEMGKPAKTLIRVVAHVTRGNWKYSLLVVRICTGRRHQIRTHLHHVRHPSVTDGKYTRAAIFMADSIWCPRNFLHRQRLQFRDADRIVREVTEPMPQDLCKALRCLSPVGRRSEVAVEEWADGQRSPRPWDNYDVLEVDYAVATSADSELADGENDFGVCGACAWGSGLYNVYTQPIEV